MRGFAASRCLSIKRLKAMAALRAPTIATSTHSSTASGGRPSVATSRLIRANGSAKTVCSNLMRDK